jgi:peptidoglycan/LPS O-acetylase OafA/YrhL
MGVDLFFVLSGYFIGRLLWREVRSYQSVRIGRFILRRGLRIWPLYFFFFVFSGFVLGRASANHGWSDLVFLTNYANHGVVMGSWSLCTEEQFYLAAPLLILLGIDSGMSLRGFRRVLVALLFLLPIIRMITWICAAGSLRSLTRNYGFPLSIRLFIRIATA